jgi:diguanylate cyclase (GGDEF)-like protein
LEGIRSFWSWEAAFLYAGKVIGKGLMKDFSLKTRSYIIGILIIGFLLVIYSISHWNWSTTWIQTIVLSVLASLALLFKVEGTTNRTSYNIAFLVYGFTIIALGGPQAIIVITVAHIVEWIWHKYPWYIQLFNLGSFIIVTVGTSSVYELANPTRILGSWQAALSMLAAMVVFTLLNHLLIGFIVWLARGENIAQSGIFEFFPLMLDLVMLSLGAGLAVLWAFNPLAIVLVLLSLYLIYTTLRVPALERKAETDSKTGLFNHQYFATSLDSELNRAARFNRPMVIVMADLDLLRNINNTYGHLAGDEVLIGVAGILKKHSREYDVVARFGGEEYAILMPETTAEEAYGMADAIRDAVEKAEFQVPTSVSPIKATLSMGIAQREKGLDSKAIIHNADMALYHAKLKGRNRVYVYSDEGFEELFHPVHDRNPESQTSQSNAIPQEIPRANTAETAEVAGSTRKRTQKISRKPGAEVDADPNLVDEQDFHPAGAGKSHMWVNILIFSLVAAAFGLFTSMFLSQVSFDWMGILVFTILVIITEWASVDIYVRNTSISTSVVPFIAGVILFGPVGALVMSLAIGIVAWIKHKSPFSRFLFNVANQLFASQLCIGIIRVTGTDFGSWSFGVQLAACITAGLLVFLITTSMIATGMSLNFRVPAKQIWSEQFSWLTFYYLGMGLLAYPMVFSYQKLGIIGTVVILTPLFFLRLSQKQYINRTKTAIQELNKKNKILEDRSGELTRLSNGLLDVLAEVIDLRAPYFLGHSKQVSDYAVLIAQEMRLQTSQIELIRKASLVHDVGILGIDTSLLAKPTGLTHEEYETIKQHVTVGTNLLQQSPALKPLITTVLHHHEHFDGMGYPEGLQGAEIPIEARIVCLADAIDAMASNRPYRKAMGFEAILVEVRRCSGSHFDPSVVEAFEVIARKQGPGFIIGGSENELFSARALPVLRNPSQNKLR